MVLLLLLLLHHRSNFLICTGSKFFNLPTSLEVSHNTFYLWTVFDFNTCMTAFVLQTFSTTNCVFGLILLLSTKTFTLSTSVCSFCHMCNKFTPSIILLFSPMIHKMSHKKHTNYVQTFWSSCPSLYSIMHSITLHKAGWEQCALFNDTISYQDNSSGDRWILSTLEKTSPSATMSTINPM
jgi:hypothetical protein